MLDDAQQVSKPARQETMLVMFRTKERIEKQAQLLIHVLGVAKLSQALLPGTLQRFVRFVSLKRFHDLCQYRLFEVRTLTP